MGGVGVRPEYFLPSLPGVWSLQAAGFSCCKGPLCFQLPNEPSSRDSHSLPSTDGGWVVTFSEY